MADRGILSLELALGVTGNEFLQIVQPTGLAAPNDFLDKKLKTSAFTAFSAGSAVQTQNTVYAGPTTGPSAAPTFRALVNADIPTLATLNFSSGGVINFNASDVTITHSANLLTFAGANSGYSFDNPVNIVTAAAATASLKSMTTNDSTGSFNMLRLESDRATPTNNDTIFMQWLLSDSAGNQTEFGRMDCRALNVTAGAEDGVLRFWLTTAGTITERIQIINTALRPTSNNVMSLGIATVAWTSLFLAAA